METKLHLPAFTSFLEAVVTRLGAALARLAWRPDAAGHQSLGAEELRAMSDLELKDLGIGRSEVPHALRSAWSDR
jgi:hypothetical protein